jgi:hypothetical protein
MFKIHLLDKKQPFPTPVELSLYQHLDNVWSGESFN